MNKDADNYIFANQKVHSSFYDLHLYVINIC